MKKLIDRQAPHLAVCAGQMAELLPKLSALATTVFDDCRCHLPRQGSSHLEIADREAHRSFKAHINPSH